MKNHLSKLGLVFLLAIFTFYSCGKDEEIEIPQEQNSIKIKIEDKIENSEVESLIKNEIENINYHFNAYSTNAISNKTNDSLTLRDIEINTEVFSVIEKENGETSYTFEVDFPNGSLKNEIINLHLFYDENNVLNSRLIGYDLTQNEMEIAKSNQSFDGFYDKIYYLELEEFEFPTAKSSSSKSSSTNKRPPCDGIFNCETTGGATWIPYANNSGYGGSSGPGSSYSLPPLNTLPPHVTAALQAAGVFVGIDYNNLTLVPYTGSINYTSPV